MFIPFVFSKADLHKRLLFTMWNSDSTTRYRLRMLTMLFVRLMMVVIGRETDLCFSFQLKLLF